LIGAVILSPCQFWQGVFVLGKDTLSRWVGVLVVLVALLAAGRGASAHERGAGSVGDRPEQERIFRTVVHAGRDATAHERGAGSVGDRPEQERIFRADSESQARQRAVAWLHTQQLPDGSFGHAGRSSASVTADAIYVLALLGEDPTGPAWTINGHSALAALAALAPSYVGADAGQAGKVARAVALADGNPRAFAGLNLVAIIQAAYNPATGRYHPTLLFRHTLAVEGLLRAGEPVPPAALDALLAAQRPDGGWFWSFDGATSDVDTTGRVLQLLAAHAGVRCAPALAQAADYLAAAQVSTGGWGVYPAPNPNPANANSTALAVAGLRATGYDPAGPRFQKNGRGAVETLLSFQEAGGAFVYVQQVGREESRVLATIDALNALAQPLAGPIVCRPLYLPVLMHSHYPF
jgi:hypothetical protein